MRYFTLILWIIGGLALNNNIGLSQSIQSSPITALSIYAGTGVLTFNGDVGKGNNVSSYTDIRGGYSFGIEKDFAKNWFGVGGNIIAGKFAKSERSIDPTRNRNFQTSLLQYGIHLTINIQNKKDIPVIPYLTGGISFAQYKTFTDLKFHGDSLYNYWTDGSIRNLPETDENKLISRRLSRDYKYETPLDSAAKSSIVFPVGGGVKLQIGQRVEAAIGASYNITLSNEIDGFILKKGNDAYVYSYVSFTYKIFKRDKNAKQNRVDYAAINRLDSDNDGITDIIDDCPGTPKGVQVDTKGCPLDSDSDGIPDYLDKEPNTQAEAIVDMEGITINNSTLAEHPKPSVSPNNNPPAETATQHTDNSSIEKANQLDNTVVASSSNAIKAFSSETEITTVVTATNNSANRISRIPGEFQSADLNHDGTITANEIKRIISDFFEGDNDYSIDKINALINYFFEQ